MDDRHGQCASHGKVELCLDCSEGRWQIDTANGTTFLIDVSGEWIERHVAGAGPVWGGDKRLRLIGLVPVRIGEPLCFVVQGSADGMVFSSHRAAEVVLVRQFDQDGRDSLSDAALAEGLDGDESPGLVYVRNGVLTNVHPVSACANQPWGCWIHSPRHHALADAPVVWRSDRQFAERICEHGIGHPDPQDVTYNWRVLGKDISVHGCDGCCGALQGWGDTSDD